MFKQHGVVDFVQLNWNPLTTKCESIVYLVRPTVKNCRQIARQIKQHIQEQRDQKMQKGQQDEEEHTRVTKYSLYFVPRSVSFHFTITFGDACHLASKFCHKEEANKRCSPSTMLTCHQIRFHYTSFCCSSAVIHLRTGAHGGGCLCQCQAHSRISTGTDPLRLRHFIHGTAMLFRVRRAW